MSYIALYRKYRPLNFDDVVGQENVTKILKNQIKANKISHAYIFSGCRGTGKTSAAKIFSRAVNCLNPQDGEPCNECDVCKKILEGTTTDVVEMDAASNNSVENIRQIRQEVVYSTVDAKYRVYIIDEAHMLTTSAFNALLKTLEEPPENVIFILATTEQHKIPITILSRCLKFEFGRLSKESISKRLKFVLEKENIEYDEKSVSYIANLADGALRDALSILDRCQSESQSKLEYHDILKIVGGIDKDAIKNIVSAILKFDSKEAICRLDELFDKGKDVRQLNSLLINEFLNILVNKNNEKAEYENINVDDKRIIDIIDRLSKLDNELRYAISSNIVMKAGIIEICMVSYSSKAQNLNNSSSNDPQIIKVLEDKINNLEKRLDELSKRPVTFQNSSNTMKNIEKSMKAEVDVSKICESFAGMDELRKECAKCGKLKLFSSLTGAKAYKKENILLFIISNKFAYDILMKQDNFEDLYGIISNLYGDNLIVKIELKEEKEDEETIIERVLKESGINYKNLD